MVHKLHKVSDKLASTLGFWTPGIVLKEGSLAFGVGSAIFPIA